MFNTLFQYIAKILIAPVVLMMGAAGYQVSQVPQNDKVGTVPQYVAAAPTTLFGYGIGSTDASIRLTHLETPDGSFITTNQLIGGISGPGSVFYGTIEPATTRKETISCTGVTQNADLSATLTGCTRGLAFTYPYTPIASLAVPHAGGSAFVISNSPQLYNDIQSVIANSASSGASDASQSVKGILALATVSQAASHAAIGSGNTSAALALYTTISSSTRVANTAQVMVSSSTSGYIDATFIGPQSLYNISPTGTSTFVNSAQTILSTSTVSVNGATSSATMIGSFPAYQIGKNFQIFLNSGTFIPPKGVLKVLVQAVGGGGGGHSCSASCGGGGGGAGAYCFKVADVSATSSIGIGISGGGTATADGGPTWVSSYCVAGGGAHSSSTAAPGGTATGGDINIAGGDGGQGITDSNSSTVNGYGGTGGASVFGGGGAGGNGNASGNSGVAYGSGGGGASGNNGGGGGTGGSGASGIVIISW